MKYNIKLKNNKGETIYSGNHTSNSSITALNEAINRVGHDINTIGFTVKVKEIKDKD